MKSWETAKLGELVESVTTWNPLRSGAEEGFRYIDLSAVDQDVKQIVDAREVSCSEAPSRARQLVADGDVLVSTVRPNLNGVAVVPQQLDGATASTGFCVLRPKPQKLDGRFLFQWVKSRAFVSDMVSKASGASYPAVSDRIIFDSKLSLPLLPEQRRIAAILDQAETLRTQRRAALAQLDSLTQSIFLDMFGDPVTNPKGWPKLPFSEACETRLGKMLDAKQQTGINKRCYLRNANVQWFRIDLTDLLEMDFDSGARETFRLLKGDLLICEGGEPGRAAVWQGELEDVYYQKALHRGRPKLGIAHPDYLAWLLWFLAHRGGLGDHVTAATIAHLTGEKLKAMAIPLPPLPLQQTFATRIQAIEALKATHRAALAELDALFASLQQRAFSGELTQSTSPAQVAQTKARDFSELCKLDADKGLEVLIYVAKRMPEHHFYKALKALYFADKHQLEHQGRLIYGETHCALPMGPVPQAAYDAAKVLSGELLVSAFADDALRASLRRTEKELIPLRDADPQKLSAEERASLDWAIRYVAPMSFDQVKTASHDSAYERTPRNQPIRLEHIVEMLPEAAKKRFFA